mmetsp:Transcript_2707/g.5051  ORF Transcript_2707/g.5051 Transcript_2707/m.5051 type:complete len:227 (-) Transcript_2707:540-1220(-)
MAWCCRALRGAPRTIVCAPPMPPRPRSMWHSSLPCTWRSVVPRTCGRRPGRPCACTRTCRRCTTWARSTSPAPRRSRRRSGRRGACAWHARRSKPRGPQAGVGKGRVCKATALAWPFQSALRTGVLCVLRPASASHGLPCVCLRPGFISAARSVSFCFCFLVPGAPMCPFWLKVVCNLDGSSTTEAHTPLRGVVMTFVGRPDSPTTLPPPKTCLRIGLRPGSQFSF